MGPHDCIPRVRAPCCHCSDTLGALLLLGKSVLEKLISPEASEEQARGHRLPVETLITVRFIKAYVA